MLSDGRKIIDSFLFSEPHEKEVLLAKLMAGDDVIDEYVAIECAYTFRGEYKGLSLCPMLCEDERFKPFMDRITVISQPDNMFWGKQCESNYFKVEFASRELSKDYLLAKYTDRDIVTSSDVDEMLDFSDPWRREQLDRILIETANKNRITFVKKLKCWYDFDNFCTERVWLPAGPLSVVKHHWQQRLAKCPYEAFYEPFPLAFEYSYCFAKYDILRKLMTYSHEGFTLEDVERALAGNHWCKVSAKGQKPGDRAEDFFKTEPLTEKNSTRYVRENIERLKTHNVGR